MKCPKLANVMFDYAGNVLPKIKTKQPLNAIDKTVVEIVENVKNNKWSTVEELLGRIELDKGVKLPQK